MFTSNKNSKKTPLSDVETFTKIDNAITVLHNGIQNKASSLEVERSNLTRLVTESGNAHVTIKPDFLPEYANSNNKNNKNGPSFSTSREYKFINFIKSDLTIIQYVILFCHDPKTIEALLKFLGSAYFNTLKEKKLVCTDETGNKFQEVPYLAFFTSIQKVNVINTLCKTITSSFESIKSIESMPQYPTLKESPSNVPQVDIPLEEYSMLLSAALYNSDENALKTILPYFEPKKLTIAFTTNTEDNVKIKANLLHWMLLPVPKDLNDAKRIVENIETILDSIDSALAKNMFMDIATSTRANDPPIQYSPLQTFFAEHIGSKTSPDLLFAIIRPLLNDPVTPAFTEEELITLIFLRRSDEKILPPYGFIINAQYNKIKKLFLEKIRFDQSHLLYEKIPKETKQDVIETIANDKDISKNLSLAGCLNLLYLTFKQISQESLIKKMKESQDILLDLLMKKIKDSSLVKDQNQYANFITVFDELISNETSRNLLTPLLMESNFNMRDLFTLFEITNTNGGKRWDMFNTLQKFYSQKNNTEQWKSCLEKLNILVYESSPKRSTEDGIFLEKCWIELYKATNNVNDLETKATEQSGEAFLLKGHAYNTLGNSSEAIKNYCQAIILNPKLADIANVNTIDRINTHFKKLIDLSNTLPNENTKNNKFNAFTCIVECINTEIKKLIDQHELTVDEVDNAHNLLKLRKNFNSTWLNLLRTLAERIYTDIDMFNPAMGYLYSLTIQKWDLNFDRNLDIRYLFSRSPHPRNKAILLPNSKEKPNPLDELLDIVLTPISSIFTFSSKIAACEAAQNKARQELIQHINQHTDSISKIGDLEDKLLDALDLASVLHNARVLVGLILTDQTDSQSYLVLLEKIIKLEKRNEKFASIRNDIFLFIEATEKKNPVLSEMAIKLKNTLNYSSNSQSKPSAPPVTLDEENEALKDQIAKLNNQLSRINRENEDLKSKLARALKRAQQATEGETQEDESQPTYGGLRVFKHY